MCEALEFGIEKMKQGECARLRAPWAMFAGKPPVEISAAAMGIDDVNITAEVTVELARFEPGAQSNILNMFNDPTDPIKEDEASKESKDRKLKEFVQLIDCAKQIRDRGTVLFKGQRYHLAIYRYNNACELLAMLNEDTAAAIGNDPIMGMMGMKDSDLKEAQSCLQSLLSEDDRSAAKAIYLTSKLNAAQCYLNLKIWKKVVGLCDEVLKQDPGSVKAHYRKAQAMIGDGEFKQAQLSLQELLRVEPENAAAKKLLHETMHKLKAETAAEKQRMKKAMAVACDQSVLTGGRVAEYGETAAAAMQGMDMGMGMGMGGYKPGMSPLDVAKSMGRTEIVNVMEEHLVKRSIEEIMDTYAVTREEAEEIRERGGL